jgi:hypothetical protein
MAYETGIDYALHYGQNDPLYDMLRRRLRDRVSAYMQGQQQYALGRLDARGLGQSSAVGQTLGSIAAGGGQQLAAGNAGISEQQARERFALLQDAIRRQAAKPGVWDVLPGLAGAAGSSIPGISSLLLSAAAAPMTDYTNEPDYNYG